jgi:putative transcriptional regulator
MRILTPALALPILFVLLAGSALAYMRPFASHSGSGTDGQLLVANRQLADPNFARSVIYMIDHSEQGAMGLIVNRAVGTGTLKEVLGAVGIKTQKHDKVTLYAGGPVEPNRGFLLHSPDYVGTSTQLMGKEIALSTGLDVMRAIAKGMGPKRSRFLLGYAGWGAGQLDREIGRGDWLIAPADSALIFSSEPDTVWEQALQRAGIAL